MREIKYQAWLNKQQRMIDVEAIKFIDIGGKTHAEVTAKVDHEKGGWYTEIRESTHRKTVAPGSDRQVPRVILRQYTGLKDKNGTEIYEGDIVDIGIPLDRTRRNFVGEISYCTEFACFRVDHPNIILISEYDGIEVIGNIYEDKHLMEGK